MPTTYEFETVLVEQRDGIARVTFNRPEKRNSISPELSRDMNHLLDRLKDDDEVRVVVVTGAGDQAFCAGMSLAHFVQFKDQPHLLSKPGESANDWWNKLRTLPKPTIAMVNGYCIGGGFSVVGCCDLAIASERAMFSLSEINFGSAPGGGAARAALETVPYKHAMYLILTGKPINAAEAARIGFVNQAVPHDQLEGVTMELAASLATHHPMIMAWTKRMAQNSMAIPDYLLGVEYETAMSIWASRQAGNIGRNVGLQAFVDKEYKPGLESFDFRGRTEG